jgi:uncharacterized repeat protein (TIGR03803 family)
MARLSGWKMVGLVVVLSAGAAAGAPAQTFTNLVDFTGPNGGNPIYMSLVQGTDGALYGTTGGGGAYGGGTIFRITQAGTLSTLYSFCAVDACADRVGPSGALRHNRQWRSAQWRDSVQNYSVRVPDDTLQLLRPNELHRRPRTLRWRDSGP